MKSTKTRIKKGSYATVLVKNTSVQKIQPLVTDRRLDLYTYTDAIMSLFVSSVSTRTNGLPALTGILVDDNKNELRMRMANYGMTLDEWCKVTPHNERMACLPVFIIQLCDACNVLFKAGIQHPDIKPANILVNPANNCLKLIDYNIYSVQTLSGWTETVGTWCYVPPEILFHSAPSDTSMTWSIGMMIAEICGAGYALGPINSLMSESVMGDRIEWEYLFADLKERHPENFLVSSKHTLAMTDIRWKQIFNACTKWHPRDRVTLEALSAMITPILTIEHPPAVFVNHNSRAVHIVPSVCRDAAIDHISKLCNIDIQIYGDLMYRSIYLYDLLTPTDVHPVICMCIANVMLGYCLDKTLLSLFKTEFDYTKTLEETEVDMINVLNDRRVNIGVLYWIGADIVALRSGMLKQDCMTHLPEVMKKIQSPYTCSTVVAALSIAVGTPA